MCLFPLPNSLIDGLAYKKGVVRFDCGACPECLKKRASRIMLRDVMEAKYNSENCMLTLTYDSYLRDSNGRIIGEKVSDRRVDVKDVQKFVKRLRMYVLRHFGKTFKYRVSAEYGKHTHRPHYHVLLFGFCFPDLVQYKKSKRGNWIYKSPLLNKIWKFGICTVDSKRLTPAIARYCSKYTSKDHNAEDTFSLCSRGIGFRGLIENFNGLYYVVDGIKYPIPRDVWQCYITEKYAGGKYHFCTKYVNKTSETLADGSYYYACRQRRKYQIIRDHDPEYIQYLEFWQKYGTMFEDKRSFDEKLTSLPMKDYSGYRASARFVYGKRLSGIPYPAPRSNCKSAYERYLLELSRKGVNVICPIHSCLNRANDTFNYERDKMRVLGVRVKEDFEKNPFDNLKKIQISIDNLCD